VSQSELVHQRSVRVTSVLVGPLPRCEQCGRGFERTHGAICGACGKRLCRIHFSGPLARWTGLLWWLTRRRRVCVGCRARKGLQRSSGLL
jgi:predicted amidophosphoribosyltransferase